MDLHVVNRGTASRRHFFRESKSMREQCRAQVEGTTEAHWNFSVTNYHGTVYYIYMPERRPYA